ncbi:MAG: hypothetical protein HZC41_22555 [Chloroflexi bacterium]|nr:hypothetical protein [Chloroflexota bacterium]
MSANEVLTGCRRLWPLIGWLLALLLTACATNDQPQGRAVLPLADDKPTFLWFFTDP